MRSKLSVSGSIDNTANISANLSMKNVPDAAASQDFTRTVCVAARHRRLGEASKEHKCCGGEGRKLFFPWSHLRDGTDTNTVDEGTLKNLAFLQEPNRG